MSEIKNIIIDFFKTRDIQQFINNRFYDRDKAVIDKRIFNYVVHKNGLKFVPDFMLFTVEQVEDYEIKDLRKTDIVLDIGACIGAFSLKIYNKVSKVFAVEPIMTDVLIKNKDINNANNISIIDAALGKGDIIEIKWYRYKKKIKTLSLSEIIALCGGHVDFLKIDCEGGEWYIKSDELKDIRIIEAELHNFDKKHRFEEFFKMLDRAGFEYHFEKLTNQQIVILHARNKFLR